MSDETASNVEFFIQSIKTIKPGHKKLKRFVKFILPVVLVMIVGILLVIFLLHFKSAAIDSTQMMKQVTTASVEHSDLCREKECLYSSECQIINLPLPTGPELLAKCICHQNYTGDRCEEFSPQ